MALSDYLDSMDFTTLRKLMLDMAPDDVDKTEGSFIYDAVTPIALFVSEIMGQMKLVLEQSFIGTATGTNLDTLAATMPRIYRRGAISEKLLLRLSPYTQTIRDYIVNNKDSLQFSNSSGETYKVDAEQDDYISNDHDNIYVRVYKTVLGKGSAVKGQTMEPSPAISGLSECVVSEVTSGGGDAEDDDHFRVRVWASMSSPFLGTVSDYQRKIFSDFPLSANGFDIENCFIIPRGSRSGYICVIPAKSGENGAVKHCTSGELTSLQDYLDKRVDKIGGFGFGVAPIGHVVRVRDFSEYRLHQRVTVTVAKSRMNEVSQEEVERRVTSATNSYLRSLIDDVVPSSTNYMANAKRYVNFFIYYYVNAHEYAVLSALKSAYSSSKDLIKNVLIERDKFIGRITDSYVATGKDGAYIELSSGDVSVTEVYINNVNVDDSSGWKIEELSLSSATVTNIMDYVSLEYVNHKLVLRRNGTYAGPGVVLTDLKLNREYDAHEFLEQKDLVIKSGDSKGTLPVIGNITVKIVEAEG